MAQSRLESMWRELDEPQLGAGWELFVDIAGIHIYRFYREETCLYEYKICGTISDCAPELFVDVYMDLDYRKQWDSYVKELKELDHSGQKVIYWEVKYPFLMSNRDYVYGRELHDLNINGRKIWVIIAKSKYVPELPAKAGIIRVEDYHQTVALESDGKQGMKVFLHYFDNPGGLIPTFLVNWAAKTGVPSFLKDMQKACANYPEYCKKSGKKSALY
ncbi:phosphatidylcholine transfer protein isoform X2 [Hypanus sabinus]|uniref:phosphatidylcholine transfer protein isoform X2 n=1 Tax=Hypanus sabinus TaxID=79690 RepID=UPI0028C3BDEC|nr:phosphatidylcholine transfer protein isoform X2 [Hypanus sabinus]